MKRFPVILLLGLSMVSLMDSLSNREREVILLLLEGLANQEIAEKLCLAESTIKTHLHNIYQKIGVHNRSEAYAKLMNNMMEV